MQAKREMFFKTVYLHALCNIVEAPTRILLQKMPIYYNINWSIFSTKVTISGLLTCASAPTDSPL